MEIAEQIADATNGKPMIGLVNAPFLANMGKPNFKCWLELGKRLAKILRKMSNGYGNIEIEAIGDALQDASGLIKAGVACGFAEQDCPDVNLINSIETLKGKGVEISWTHAVGDVSQLSVAVSTDPVMKLAGVTIGNSLLLTKLNNTCLSGPVALDNNTFFHATAEQGEFLRLAAENGFKICSFVKLEDSNSIVGTLAGFSEEKLPKCCITCSF